MREKSVTSQSVHWLVAWCPRTVRNNSPTQISPVILS